MIDLHIHSKYSDGKKTLTEILKIADYNNLEYISITDHDNVDVYYELLNMDYKKYFKGKIIKGAEIRAICNKVPIEILAYDYDLDLLDKYLDYTNQKVKTAYIEQFDHLKNVCKNNRN
ncbi:MAG: PHP domain-containing protein [Clostridia bacterium]